jgi:hypothetical protein
MLYSSGEAAEKGRRVWKSGRGGGGGGGDVSGAPPRRGHGICFRARRRRFEGWIFYMCICGAKLSARERRWNCGWQKGIEAAITGRTASNGTLMWTILLEFELMEGLFRMRRAMQATRAEAPNSGCAPLRSNVNVKDSAANPHFYSMSWPQSTHIIALNQALHSIKPLCQFHCLPRQIALAVASRPSK